MNKRVTISIAVAVLYGVTYNISNASNTEQMPTLPNFETPHFKNGHITEVGVLYNCGVIAELTGTRSDYRELISFANQLAGINTQQSKALYRDAILAVSHGFRGNTQAMKIWWDQNCDMQFKKMANLKAVSS